MSLDLVHLDFVEVKSELKLARIKLHYLEVLFHHSGLDNHPFSRTPPNTSKDSCFLRPTNTNRIKGKFDSICFTQSTTQAIIFLFIVYMH